MKRVEPLGLEQSDSILRPWSLGASFLRCFLESFSFHLTVDAKRNLCWSEYFSNAGMRLRQGLPAGTMVTVSFRPAGHNCGLRFYVQFICPDERTKVPPPRASQPPGPLCLAGSTLRDKPRNDRVLNAMCLAFVYRPACPGHIDVAFGRCAKPLGLRLKVLRQATRQRA